MKNSRFKNIILNSIKNTTSGIFIGLGIIISIFGVVAFENLTSNPSDTGNQSLSSPLLSKIGGVFDRDTMSLEAIARGTINWNDCEYKTGSPVANNTTITCSTGYILVDHSCSVTGARGTYRSRGQCKLNGINSLRIENANTNGTWPVHGSIKCCKPLAI